MIRKVNFKIFPRLHLTLIGMNNDGYRINGGIGFSIDKDQISLDIYSSEKFICLDKRDISFKNEEILRIQNITDSVVLEKSFNQNIKIIISGSTPTHCGFGTSTSIRLAVLEGLFIINNTDYSPTTIIKLSGRGQTSGIGIRTYFNGGFVFDMGHQNLLKHQPSSKREGNLEESLLLKECEMPDWEIGICIPLFIEPITEEKELNFFNNTCPIEAENVYETLNSVLNV